MSHFIKTSRNFATNRDGNVATVFSIALIPMIAGAALAVDYSRAINARQQLQAAADAATLAAGNTRDANSRERVANATLDVSLGGGSQLTGASRTITAGADIFKIRLAANVPTTVGGLFVPNIGVTAESTSSVAKDGGAGAPACLVSLNPTQAATTRFWGAADLIAPGCAVYSNSGSAGGLEIGGSATATAAKFCTAGAAYTGSAFSPLPNTQCAAVPDPFAGKFTPSAVQTSSGVNLQTGCHKNSRHRPVNGETIDSTAQGTNGVMRFCGGLEVKAGVSVTFKPGIYVVEGSLDVGSNATLNAQGVVFYFMLGGGGTKDAPLTVQGGGNLNLKAPATGPFAGMAIVQPQVNGYSTTSSTPFTHTIIGGGIVDIVGMIYTPQAKVRVTGNGDINQNSTYFGIVADRVELEGNGVLRIKAAGDAATASLPPMTSFEATTVSSKATLIK